MTDRRILGACAAALLLTVGCAQEEALKRVENEVGDLKIQVNRLRLEVEEQNRKADAERATQQETRAEDRRFRADLGEALRQVQDATRSVNGRLNEVARRPVNKTPQAVEGPAVDAEERAFQALMMDYNQAKYALAAESFEAYLKGNPPSARKPEALFFLGLSYFNGKVFDKALQAFDRIIKEHGQSERLVPAMLKKAQCQLQMNLKAAALKGFKEIVDKFPGTPEARSAQEELGELQ